MGDGIPGSTESTRELGVSAEDLRFGLGQRVRADRAEATPQLLEISCSHPALSVNVRPRRGSFGTAIRRRTVVKRTLLELQKPGASARGVLVW